MVFKGHKLGKILKTEFSFYFLIFKLVKLKESDVLTLSQNSSLKD